MAHEMEKLEGVNRVATKLAIEEANEVANDTVQRTERMLNEVRRYARDITEASSLREKAKRLDWLINYVTQRHYEVAQMVRALMKLVAVQNKEE